MKKTELQDGLLLFVSFDLVNSSQYKYRNNNWPELYKTVFSSIDENINYLEFDKWKMNGDELLFCKKLNKLSIESDIEKIDQTMVITLNKIYNSQDLRSKFPDIKQVSIKTTIWCAFVERIENINNSSSDVSVVWEEGSNIIDYFGKEIDTGFRISSCVPRSKTALSAGIIYILINIKAKMLDNIVMLGYHHLKGVWNNKKYPIYLYLREATKKDLKRSFHYDEIENELVKEFLKKDDIKIGLTDNDQLDFFEMLDYIGINKDYKEKY